MFKNNIPYRESLRLYKCFAGICFNGRDRLTGHLDRIVIYLIRMAYLIFPHIDASAATQKLGISVRDAEYVWDKTLSLYLKGKGKAEIEEEKIKCQILGIVRILGYAKSGKIKDEAVAEILRTKCVDLFKQLVG